MSEDKDHAMSRRLAALHTALVCDVLDQLGHRDAFVGADVAQLHPAGVVAGRAFTMAASAVDVPPDEPYEHLLEAFDHMAPGEVVVIGTSGEQRSGIWGEMLSVAASARGVTAAVTDGLVRDVEQIEHLGFPVFASGPSPVDCAGRLEVNSFGGRIECGEASVSAGDFILGDRMGVVAIPAETIDEVLKLAEQKNQGETTVRTELAQGDRVADVFAKHGIL